MCCNDRKENNVLCEAMTGLLFLLRRAHVGNVRAPTITTHDSHMPGQPCDNMGTVSCTYSAEPSEDLLSEASYSMSFQMESGIPSGTFVDPTG
ncbi:hypothetical protein SCLCIDRAFT_976815 [Scleroderma citrinum Foug A]|uniref:Uncharacterized protein n=1 Tax=Scleroderma citrinum Foug A TaxID=1036808 RepID=A0A0C3D255_9AGAM|nr:hypothetical protein SCLCIDRAFT_976815 [Scleroderma citrinum Foug A]